MENRILHNGVSREMTPEEIAKYAIIEQGDPWHIEEKPVRIGFDCEVYQQNLMQLVEHEKGLADRTHLAMLYSHFAENKQLFTRKNNGKIYFYCNFVFEEDEAVIRHYGGFVEYKPNNN